MRVFIHAKISPGFLSQTPGSQGTIKVRPDFVVVVLGRPSGVNQCGSQEGGRDIDVEFHFIEGEGVLGGRKAMLYSISKGASRSLSLKELHALKMGFEMRLQWEGEMACMISRKNSCNSP